MSTFDTFCVAVAGNPEGHPEAESLYKDIEHLKEKVDAGADLVVSQYFYSNAEFFKYVDKVREAGVSTNHSLSNAYSILHGILTNDTNNKNEAPNRIVGGA